MKPNPIKLKAAKREKLWSIFWWIGLLVSTCRELSLFNGFCLNARTWGLNGYLHFWRIPAQNLSMQQAEENWVQTTKFKWQIWFLFLFSSVSQFMSKRAKNILPIWVHFHYINPVQITRDSFCQCSSMLIFPLYEMRAPRSRCDKIWQSKSIKSKWRLIYCNAFSWALEKNEMHAEL